MSLIIKQPGMLTTLQDLGRYGLRNLGFSTAGAMDTLAARVTNLILGNPENAPVLEFTLTGPTLEFHKPTIICLSGGSADATVGNQFVAPNCVTPIKAGQTLKISGLKTGCRGYLGVKNGFQAREVLGSCSTHLAAGIGGLSGRALKESDRLGYNSWSAKKGFQPDIAVGREFTQYLENQADSQPVRFIRGPQSSWFSKQSLHHFYSQSYSVHPDSDRMGYRLCGQKIESSYSENLITEGTTAGSIQVPPDGQPIILMSDCQPTGGYPKIGNIISADLPRVAQLKPSDTVTFQEVSVREAQRELIEQRINLNRLAIAAEHYWNHNQDEY